MSENSYSFFATIISVLASVIISVGVSFWITYERIEKPKLELESRRIDFEFRKTSIEIHKQVLSLTPNISSVCNAILIDQWTWKISCNAKNQGVYPVDVTIPNAAISLSSDLKQIMYESGSGFNVEFPNKKQSFRATPGGAGDLWFYIVFDRAKYKEGFINTDMIVRTTFSLQTIKSASKYVNDQFPEFKEIIDEVSTVRTNFWVDLPRALPVATTPLNLPIR